MYIYEFLRQNDCKTAFYRISSLTVIKPAKYLSKSIKIQNGKKANNKYTARFRNPYTVSYHRLST